MTTAAAPAPLTDDAFLGLAFGGVELAERPGELFDTYFVRKVSADALATAITAIGAKIARKLPAVEVRTYVDDYTGPAMLWCTEHRGFAAADRVRCPEAADRARIEYVAPCTMYPAAAATVEVRVEGLPMWGEWSVGGILTRDDNGAVVATTVGAQRDDAVFAHRYAHLMGECVHCGLNRRRNTTILLVSAETGEVRPVGKSCLAEYTGSAIRVEALAAMTGLRERFAQEVGGFLTGEDASAPTAVIVALALRYIALDGRYIKVNDCDPKAVPTASKVRDALFYSDKSSRRPSVLASDLTDADLAAAAADIELVMTENTDSDYVLNLQAVAAADWAQITGKRNRVGLLASLPTAATRIRERAARKAAEQAVTAERPNRWIEQPGKRRNFVGTVVVAREVEVSDDYSYSGGSTWKTMLVVDTAEGTIKVFGSVNWPGEAPDLATLVGKPIDLTGSIPKERAYGEFRGVRQTKVQRVKVAHVG